MAFFPEPPTTISSMTDWGTYANDLMAGQFGLLFLIAFFIVVMGSTNRFGTKRSLITSLFLTFVLSVLAFVLGWATEVIVLFFMGALIFVLMFYHLNDTVL